MDIDFDRIAKLETDGKYYELMLYVVPILQQVDDWAEQNREYHATASRRLDLLKRCQPYVFHHAYCKREWYRSMECDCGVAQVLGELAKEIA